MIDEVFFYNVLMVKGYISCILSGRKSNSETPYLTGSYATVTGHLLSGFYQSAGICIVLLTSRDLACNFIELAWELRI